MTHWNYDTIFQEDWWLDAAAPGQWQAATVSSGGEVQARLPYVLRRSGKTVTLTQPQLTQTLGPWVRGTGASYTRALGRQMDLYAELIAQLPPFDVFRQNFAPQVTNWLPFYWEGFQQTTRYTYTIDLQRPLDEIRSEMDKRNRSRLRKAESDLKVEIHETGHIDDVLDFAEMTFKRQGLPLPYPRDLLHRIDEAAQANASRRVVICRDKHTGEAHSADYAVGDKRRIYALVSGANPHLRNSGTGLLARWTAIEWAHSFADVYDMEGSMIRPIEHRNRKYGAIQTPYMALTKVTPVSRAQQIERKVRSALWPTVKAVRDFASLTAKPAADS